MKLFLGFLFLLSLLLLLPLRLELQYDGDGLKTRWSLGPIRLLRRTQKPDGEGKAGETEQSRGGSLQKWKEIWAIFAKPLGKLLYRVRVSELTLLYCSAAQDPAAAALGYGAASAAAAALTNLITQVCRVRHYHVRSTVSFTEQKPTVFIRLQLRIMLIAALGAVIPALRELHRQNGFKKES